MVLVWLLLAILAAVHIWALISPEGMWQATTAWRYEHPEAHRPSADAFRLHRLGAVIGLIVVAGLAGALYDLPRMAEARQEERLMRDYEDCVAEHAWDPVLPPVLFCGGPPTPEGQR